MEKEPYTQKWNVRDWIMIDIQKSTNTLYKEPNAVALHHFRTYQNNIISFLPPYNMLLSYYPHNLMLHCSETSTCHFPSSNCNVIHPSRCAGSQEDAPWPYGANCSVRRVTTRWHCDRRRLPDPRIQLSPL